MVQYNVHDTAEIFTIQFSKPKPSLRESKDIPNKCNMLRLAVIN